jgi:hypothetical protein
MPDGSSVVPGGQPYDVAVPEAKLRWLFSPHTPNGLAHVGQIANLPYFAAANIAR